MMRIEFKKLALGLVLAPAVLLAGCAYDDYGYGGVNVGYGSGYYDPWYDGYYGYGYPRYGWYDGFYYPGHGYWVYDRRGHRHHWSDKHRRHWEGRRDRDRDQAGNWRNRPDRADRGQWRGGDRSGARSGWRDFGARRAEPRAGGQAAPRSDPGPRAERPAAGMRGWHDRTRGRRD
jgi:hypothetical protein